METNATKSDTRHLESRYFERMAKSLGDKTKLLRFLPPITVNNPHPRILDIGAGGGELAVFLGNEGYNMVALDANKDAIQRINALSSNIETVLVYANEGSNFLEEESFDAIVCSSILHEIFSYGDPETGIGQEVSLKRAVADFRKLLKPGGLLLVRDGVLPDNWKDTGTITLLKGHDCSSVDLYLKICPFTEASNSEYNENTNPTSPLIQLHKIAPKTFEGNVRSILEFAYTYTWGLTSFSREAQELYAVKTLSEYSVFFEDNGFNVLHSESYLQEGYARHLSYKMRLEVNGKVDEWFDSNAIWVSRKV